MITKLKITKLKNLAITVMADQVFTDMLNFCNLEPDIIKYKYKFVPNWSDHFGYTVSFENKKDPKILFTRIDKNLNTDLYSGLNLNQILKITDKICIVKGNDSVLNKNITIYVCLCVDNKIRSFIDYNDKIEKISPLIIGYKNLYEFIKNKNTIHWITSTNNEIEINLENVRIYYSIYPIPKDLNDIL